MEATKERREQEQHKDSVQLPTETSPYVQYNKEDGLEDYKMRAYGARGHLPVSDLPHGGTGTEAPTIPGTALPTAPQLQQQQHKQRAREQEETPTRPPTPSTATACRKTS